MRISGGNISTTSSGSGTYHKPVLWIVSGIAVIILYQFKAISPVVKILVILVLLGMILKFYPNIKSQLKKIGV